MLRAVSAIAGDNVKAICGRLAGEFRCIAILTGDGNTPIDIVLVKNIVDRIENRFVFSRSRIDYDMYTLFFSLISTLLNHNTLRM